MIELQKIFHLVDKLNKDTYVFKIMAFQTMLPIGIKTAKAISNYIRLIKDIFILVDGLNNGIYALGYDIKSIIHDLSNSIFLDNIK